MRFKYDFLQFITDSANFDVCFRIVRTETTFGTLFIASNSHSKNKIPFRKKEIPKGL